MLSPGIAMRAQRVGLHADDVDEVFIRGGGAGGQKVNKTSSCVQLQHVPTGVQVSCQQHRQQSANRRTAWRLLVERLEERQNHRASKRAKVAFKIRKQKARRTRRSKEKMLQDKRQRAQRKRERAEKGDQR